MALPAVLRIPGPDEKVERWHVSPLVDLAGYSWSWLWVLVPLLLLGPTRPDYLAVYLLVIAATDLHRHFGLPYVYLDRQVRERYPARFWLFPALMVAAFAISPWLAHSDWRLDGPQLCASTALLIVLLQVLRRDGGATAVPARELALVLAGSLTAALVLQFVARGSIEPAWWWSGAALFAATWFDWRRASSPALAGDPASAPPRPVAMLTSLLIVALIGLALAGRWIDALAVSVPIDTLLAVIGVFAALWNFWHVYMQKYGIMRMYNAKALVGAPVERREPIKEVPGWADKLLLLCWLPLYFAWLGPLYREIAVDYFDDAAAVLPGFIDTLEQIMPITLPLTIGLVVVAHVLWVREQSRAYGGGLRSSIPRLWMAGGTSALALCFFAFDPVKVYMAFAFSHAIEYCVFVWAFQRRRYQPQAPLEHRPLLGRMLRHPLVFYVGLILVFGVGIMLLKFWGRWIFTASPRPELFGYRTAYWLGFWGVYQSMVHFYFDGFLWKMRLPSVRANL